MDHRGCKIKQSDERNEMTHTHLELLPSISMRRGANYVTQSSIFSNCTTGPLTDRKISKYQKLGKYGPEGNKLQTKKPKTSARMSREKLIKLLI